MRAVLLPALAAACALAAGAIGLALLRGRHDPAPPSLNRDVVSEFWVAPVAGGRSRLARRERGRQDEFPVARRDGSFLFVRPTSISGQALYSWRPGRPARRLRGLPVLTPPAYSSRRDELAVTHGTHVYAETLRGRRVRVLARVPPGAMPTWSADGSTLAYARTIRTTPNPYQNELVVLRRGRTRAIPVEGSAGLLSLAPAGDRLLFTMGRKLYLLDLVSGRRRVVADDGSFSAWSPDGHTIAYSGPDGLVVLDLAGGRRRRVASRGAFASFSADGRTLVYATLKLAQSMPK